MQAERVIEDGLSVGVAGTGEASDVSGMFSADGWAIDPRPMNCLTVDLEDYYHCEVFADQIGTDRWSGFTDRLSVTVPPLLDWLNEYGVTATFFVLGWVAHHQPALIRRIAEAGHEIASHGYAHQHLTRMTPKAFAADLYQSRAAIEDAAGGHVRGFRAPTFSITRRTAWAVDVLGELGFVYDSSVFAIRHDRYGVPSAPGGPYWLDGVKGRLLELPPLTWQWGRVKLPAAGGGYLRLMPVGWTEWAIRRANAAGRPAVLYVHPWEFDVDQPAMPMTRMKRWRHRVGTAGLGEKLRGLLGRHQFRPMVDLAVQQASLCERIFSLAG